MSEERKTLKRILEYIGADLKYADYAELQTYLEQYSSGLNRQLSSFQKELAEAQEKLSQISGLCENCTGLSDAQAIARGQKLDYINTSGCFDNKKPCLHEQLADLTRVKKSTDYIKDYEA